jgi:hypothetical protein
MKTIMQRCVALIVFCGSRSTNLKSSLPSIEEIEKEFKGNEEL